MIDILEFARANNVAELLNDKALDEIGQDALQGYEDDVASRYEWEDRNEQWMNLAAQVVEQKSFPWENSSNVKYPLLTTAAIQFHARAYPSLVPNADLVKTRVVGFDHDGSKRDKAIRISKHMTYQLIEEMEEWEEDMDRLLLTLPIVGCAFKKTYFSVLLGRNVSEMITAKDLVVDYWAKDLKSAQRISHKIYLSQNEVVERIRKGIFLDLPLGSSSATEHEGSLDEIQGTSPAGESDDSPYMFIEQHCWLDLDDDGYAEPYIVTFEEGSGDVFRIVPRYDEKRVEFNDKGEVAKINPIEYFTKFSFIPNPDGGFYDVGFGILLGPINDTSNTIINQLIDAGTLSNLQSGFLGRGARLKRGDTRFVPGEWKQVNASGDDLRKNVFPMPVREPSGVLFNLLSLLLDSGKSLANTTDVLMGENPGQNQPASTTMAVIEQGLKVFTAIYKRIHRGLKQEFKKLFVLNSLYLPEKVYFAVLDPSEEEVQTIGKSDYTEGVLDVIPASDSNIVSEAQKLAKAQGLMELLQLGTVNPMVVTQRILEAQEQPGIEELMTMPPPQPNPEVVLEQQKLQLEAELGHRELDIKEAQLQVNVGKTDVDNQLKIARDGREERKLAQEEVAFIEEKESPDKKETDTGE